MIPYKSVYWVGQDPVNMKMRVAAFRVAAWS